MSGQLELFVMLLALWPVWRVLNRIERWYRCTYRKDPRYIPSDFD